MKRARRVPEKPAGNPPVTGVGAQSKKTAAEGGAPGAGEDGERAGGVAGGARKRRRKRKKAVLPSKQDHQIALDPVEEAFAAAEVRARAEHGWSIDEVAARAQVRRGTIQHLEHRRRGVSLRVASRIAEAFGRRLGQFLKTGGKIFLLVLKGAPALGMA